MGSRSELIREKLSKRHSLCQRRLSEVFEGYRKFYQESKPFRKPKVVYEEPEQVIDELNMEELIKLNGILAKTIMEKPVTLEEREYRRGNLSAISVIPVPNYQLFKAEQNL